MIAVPDPWRSFRVFQRCQRFVVLPVSLVVAVALTWAASSWAEGSAGWWLAILIAIPVWVVTIWLTSAVLTLIVGVIVIGVLGPLPAPELWQEGHALQVAAPPVHVPGLDGAWLARLSSSKPGGSVPYAGFSAAEWATLQLSPLWVFALVAGADGIIDERETLALVKELSESHLFRGELARQVLASLSVDVDGWSSAVLTDRREPLQGLVEVRALLDARASTEDAELMKTALLLIGRNVAQASGGMVGMDDPLSPEERVALTAIAGTLGVGA